MCLHYIIWMCFWMTDALSDRFQRILLQTINKWRLYLLSRSEDKREHAAAVGTSGPSTTLSQMFISRQLSLWGCGIVKFMVMPFGLCKTSQLKQPIKKETLATHAEVIGISVCVPLQMPCYLSITPIDWNMHTKYKHPLPPEAYFSILTSDRGHTIKLPK